MKNGIGALCVFCILSAAQMMGVPSSAFAQVAGANGAADDEVANIVQSPLWAKLSQSERDAFLIESKEVHIDVRQSSDYMRGLSICRTFDLHPDAFMGAGKFLVNLTLSSSSDLAHVVLPEYLLAFFSRRGLSPVAFHLLHSAGYAVALSDCKAGMIKRNLIDATLITADFAVKFGLLYGGSKLYRAFKVTALLKQLTDVYPKLPFITKALTGAFGSYYAVSTGQDLIQFFRANDNVVSPHVREMTKAYDNETVQLLEDTMRERLAQIGFLKAMLAKRCANDSLAEKLKTQINRDQYNYVAMNVLVKSMTSEKEK